MAKTHSPSHGDTDALAVVIVTWRCADTIPQTLASLKDQLRQGDELVIVDNASNDGTAEAVEKAAPGAKVVRMKQNLGFAAGCQAGADASTAPLLLFLNPDAKPEPGALAALRGAAADQPAWGAWQAAVTLPDGTLNTGGGVVHFLGFAWAGNLGEPYESLEGRPTEVAFASGAAMVVRRDLWNELDGFDRSFFMYSEDVDLSLRIRLAGHGVGVVPSARVLHEYEFDKGERKWFLLERNRWWVVLTTYPLPLLLPLLPLLLATEVALLPVAATGGWLPSKLRAQRAVIASLPHVLRRRRAVQAKVGVTTRVFADSLVPDLSSPYLGRAGRSRPLACALRAYWRGVLALLRG